MVTRFVTISESDQMRLRILRAIDQPIEGMSIKEISEKAGISRQTFYNHFAEKHDVVAWYGSFLARHILTEIGVSLTWEEGIREYLEAILDNRNAFEMSAGSSLQGVEYMLSQKQSAQRRSAMIQESLAQRRKAPLSDDDVYVIDAWALTEGRLMTLWIQDGCKTDPAVLARRIALCVPQMLKESLALDR